MMDTEIAFLAELVRIPSYSCQEHEAVAFLVNFMREHHLVAHVDQVGNAIGMVGEKGPVIALLGHIDTVAGHIPVRIEHGRLYGRGSVDAKGPLAAFVCATLRAIARGTLDCRVVLIGAVEEEVASSRGAHHAVGCYRPDACIIGEPSGWDRITLGYKGRLLTDYRRQQPAAHGAGMLRAAPEYLVDFWFAVQRYCEQQNQGYERLFEQLTPALQSVHSLSDGLCDVVEATIGFRLPERIHPTELASAIQALADGDTQLSFRGACPAFRSPRTTPLAAAFVRAIRANGGQPGFLHKTGTSDMNIAGPAWGCPIVSYGPGDAHLDHTPQEHLVLEEYDKAIAVLTHVLETCSTLRFDR